MKTHRANYLITIIICMLLVSCKHADLAYDTFNAKYTAITDTLTLKSFNAYKALKFTKAGIQNQENISVDVVDTFLICKTLNASKILNIYGLRSKKFLGALIDRGDQTGQCLGVANILPTSKKNIVWLFDITLGKLIKVNLTRSLKDTSTKPLDEIVLSGKLRGAKSVALINDTTFAACSYYNNNYRYYIFNKIKLLQKVGELVPSLSNWPENKVNGKFAIDAIIYNASLLFNRQNKQSVVAYNKTDRLEFYRDNKLFKVSRGFELFDPVVDFKEEGDNLFMPVENQSTRYAYIYIAGTDESIYTLRSFKNKYKSQGNQILKFTWGGVPEGIYNLDANYSGFAIARLNDTAICYAMKNNDGAIYCSKL